MKKVISSMAVMFFLICWPFGGLWEMMLRPIIGGGSEHSFLYPIYGGLIILTGIVVGCTVMLNEEIQKLREYLDSKNQKKEPKFKD